MDEKSLQYFEEKVKELTLDDAFRKMYEGYEYLRGLWDNPGSETHSRLHRINAGIYPIIEFYEKQDEERDEAEGVVLGIHSDPAYSKRDTMITEVTQSIYWPWVVTVGLHVPYSSIQAPLFLELGSKGHPAEYKSELHAEISYKLNEKAIIKLRRALVRAGYLLNEYNKKWAVDKGKIQPKEIAVWDLRQMAEKEYFRPYLEKVGLLEKS